MPLPKPTLAQIRQAMRRRGHVVFEDQTARGYDLNLVGVRSADTVPAVFDDWLCSFYRDPVSGAWCFHAWPCTTDPGTYYLARPLNAAGTAIVKPGQYRSVWQIGKHQGKYTALVQRGPITVYRDRNRDHVADTSGPTQTGLFGINCHRARLGGTTLRIDRWSAGCQVLANDADFDLLMRLAEEQRRRIDGSFSYTLLREEDLQEEDLTEADLQGGHA